MKSQRHILPALVLLALVFNLVFLIPANADSWTNTGTMNTTHVSHTATLFSNGNVLVAGGGGTLWSSAELYDSASRTWSVTGTLAGGHVIHTATLLPDGKVLVAGGLDSGGSNATSSAELYDSVTGAWTATGALNTARFRHTATLLPNGKVLVVGGLNGSELSSAEIYDPQTGTWTATGSTNISRNAHTATLLANGKVLVAGGTSSGSVAELYDPVVGTWTVTGSMATHRFFHTATMLHNGKVLVVGGISNEPNATSSAELYDPVTGTWAATGSLNTGRGFHTATFLPNGKVLVGGGLTFEWGGYLSSAELYDTARGTWAAASSMNSIRYSHTATLLTDGRLLVAGGNDNLGNFVSSAELYESDIVISAEPQSQVSYWGKSATLSVSAAGGVLPYTYQWLKDGKPVSGATDAQLILLNLQVEDAGEYMVTVTDAANKTVTSQTPAKLTVNPAGVSIATYAGLTIDGVIGQTYGVQVSTDLTAGNWTGAANVTLTQPIQIWYDAQSTAQQIKRFYRVVAGPISIP